MRVGVYVDGFNLYWLFELQRCALASSANLNVFVPRLVAVTSSAMKDVVKLASCGSSRTPSTEAGKYRG